MMSRLESLAKRITTTLFLLLAIGGALLVVTPRRAGADPNNANCKPNRATCTANHQCCSGVCTANVCGTPTTTTTTTPAALCDISCAPVTCASEGALCEPCSGGPRLVRIGNGFCSRTVEGDLRCQSVSCDVPASNCTSSANCPANKFCSFDPSQGANTCCPLCEAALSIPATCPFEGANCGKFVDTDSVKSDSGGISRACRTGPGFYDEGFCQPTVEGDLRCQAGGCLSTTCTSSGECGSGFFCGRDAGGPGVDLCCPLCQ